MSVLALSDDPVIVLFDGCRSRVRRHGAANAPGLAAGLPTAGRRRIAGRRSIGIVGHGPAHGAVGLADQVVDVFVAHLSGGEGGEQVDASPGGLDQRDGPGRPCERRLLPVTGNLPVWGLEAVTVPGYGAPAVAGGGGDA